MRIIGLSGKAGAGKDTVAKMIAEANVGGSTFFCPFARALKEKAREMGWNGEKDTNGRVLLQYMGVRERQDDPRYWIKRAFKTIDSFHDKDALVLITDVRFVNEAEAILKRGGQVWRVERPEYENGLSEEAKAHSSETELDGYTFNAWIWNDGTLEDLTKAVKKCMEKKL